MVVIKPCTALDQFRRGVDETEAKKSKIAKTNNNFVASRRNIIEGINLKLINNPDKK